MLYSPFISLTAEVYGKLTPPSDVLNFNMTARIDLAELKWDRVADLDVVTGGTYWIRHTSNTTGVTWAGSSDITKTVPGTLDSYSVPLLSGSYLIKALDSSGNESSTAAIVTSNVADLLALNAVRLVTQDPSFGYGTSGTGINDTRTSNITYLTADAAIKITDTSIGVGYYYFTDKKIDLGAVYTSRVTSAYASTGYAEANLFDDASGNFDARSGTFDGTDISGTNASLEIRTNLLDPTIPFVNCSNSIYTDKTACELPANGSNTWTENPDWSSWGTFFVGDYIAWGMEFRAKLITEDASNNVQINKLAVTIDMPDTTKRDIGLTTDSGTNNGTKEIVYPTPFQAPPNVAITLQGAFSGDYYTIVDDDSAGFTITFFNSSDIATQKTFNWTSIGY